MEWFNGSIADAVKLSKDKNVIFVVFIDGKPGKSIYTHPLTLTVRNFLRSQAKQMPNQWP